jgi:hypothetical protein
MGSQVGVHDVKGMKPAVRKELRAHVMRELFNSKEIRKIIEKNPKILTKVAAIRKILKDKTAPKLKQLKGQ